VPFWKGAWKKGRRPKFCQSEKKKKVWGQQKKLERGRKKGGVGGGLGGEKKI